MDDAKKRRAALHAAYNARPEVRARKNAARRAKTAAFRATNPIIRLAPEQKRENKRAGQNRLYRRKRRFVRIYKALCGCKDCGIHDSRVLELDHRNPDEKHEWLKYRNKGRSVGATKMFQLGWENLKLEIRKCDVRCANCHRIRHWEERNRGDS